jgi:prepilin-type N-terminal cleavage/methylation domain-containing protein
MRGRGFTLLEVVISLAVLALVMAAVSALQSSSLLATAEVAKMTTATQLIHSVVLDVEEEYRLEPFSENSLEGRDCKLPHGFDEFDCSYDLLALEIGSEDVSAEQGLADFNTSPLIQGLCGGQPGFGGDGEDGEEGASAPAGADKVADVASLQTLGLGMLALLADPVVMELCQIRIDKLCMNVPLIGSFIPAILDQAAASTRKLKVRVSWSERGGAERTLEIETFLVSVPAAETKVEGGEGAEVP